MRSPVIALGSLCFVVRIALGDPLIRLDQLEIKSVEYFDSATALRAALAALQPPTNPNP